MAAKPRSVAEMGAWREANQRADGYNSDDVD